MTEPCPNPLALGELAAYRVGELDEARERAVEEHYFSCADCAERLAWLDSLASSVEGAVRAGNVSSNVSSSWVNTAEARGIRMRTYEIAPGGTVHCTIAPTEDFVIVRLRVDDSDELAFDADIEMTDLKSGQRQHQRINDVSLDLESRELVYAFSGDVVRSFPRSLWQIHVRSQASERRLGSYTMDHTPWDELSESR